MKLSSEHENQVLQMTQVTRLTRLLDVMASYIQQKENYRHLRLAAVIAGDVN